MSEEDFNRQLKVAQRQLDMLSKHASSSFLSDGSSEASGLGELGKTLASLQATVAEVQQRYSDLQMRFEETKHHETRYRLLFEAAATGLVITDLAGRIVEANPAAARVLKVSPEGLSGQLLSQCMPAAAALAITTLLTQATARLQKSAKRLTAEPGTRRKSSSAKVAPAASELAQTQVSAEFVSRASVTTEPLVANPPDTSLQVQVNVLQPPQQPALLSWKLLETSGDRTLASAIQQVEQQHLRSTITQRIRQSLDPQEILDNTVLEVRQALQADRSVIYSFEDNTTAIVVAESVGKGWPLLLGNRTSEAIAQQMVAVYQEGMPRVMDDVQQSDYAADVLEMFRRQQTRAALAIPIMREQQLLGLLSVHQCQQVRSWQPLEVELLQHLTEQVAIALQHSRLYQQAQQVNADLEQQIMRRTEQVERVLKYESMLKRITDKVRDSLDESQILQAAVQELTLVLGLAGCNSALYDLEEGTSTIRYEYTHSIPTSYGRVAQMEDSPEIYTQLKLGYYFQFCSLYPNPARGRVAMLACPIFVDPNSSQGMDQAVLGDLWLIHRKDYVFNESEIRLVQQVANQCAIAIRQARLYQAAQAQVTELERLNQLKDQFLSTVSHELRTPIANVKMAIHMLKASTSEEKRQQYLGILESELAREAELINDLLDLQRLEESVSAIAAEPIHLHDWLPALVEPFRIRIANYQQTLAVSCPPDLPVLTTDPAILRRILAELLNNACKYTPRGLGISLTVEQVPAASKAPEYTVFLLSNQAEIPEADLPNIFQKFYRVLQVDRYKHGGTGLGLALVQKLVEQLHGTIAATSADGWTTFTVKLPSV